MSLGINYLSSPFKPELIPSNKDNKATFGSLKCQTPIQFASSNTHFLFLNDSNKLYGFGSNLQHQISSKKLSLFSLPIQVDLVSENSLILEIACGQDFSVIRTNNQEIEVFGCQNRKIQKSNIRGLSASNNTVAFACDISNVYIGTISKNDSKDNKKKEIIDTVFELPVPILKTAINDFSVAALGQDKNVYVYEFGSDSFTQIPSLHGLNISASHDSITVLNNNVVYVYKSQSKNITEHYLSSNFRSVLACCSYSDVFALSEDGRVSHGLIDEVELSTYSKKYKSIKPCLIDNLKSISSILMNGNSTIFIKGNPDQFNYELLPEEAPLKPGTHVKTINFNDTFICCTNKTAYFKKTTVPYSKLPSLLSYKHIDGSLYYTSSQDPIQLSNDEFVLKQLNLVIGDTIKLKSKLIKINDNDEEENSSLFEIVGVNEGHIYGRPLKSGYVICLPSDVRNFNEMFEIVERPDTVLNNFIVNGLPTPVDITPSSIEDLGYSIGDLIWHPIHGIVEVIGTSFSMLVLLEFCSRTLFTHEAIEMEILRKSGSNESQLKSDKSQKKPKKSKSTKSSNKRNVIDVNGEVISLDISSFVCPRAFLPTDRVLSPLGEATVLGFNETPYIQTDEMRMNGYEAVSVDVFDLQLIRRINGFAQRTVNLTKSSTVKISLNTEDSPNGLLPGDKIQVVDKYATVVGFTLKNDERKSDVETVIKFKGETNCCILDQPCMIIYRADINAVRKSVSAPSAFVGSPLIRESSYLPGDVLFNKEIGEVVYLGYTKDHVMFLLTKSDEIITFGFSLLLLPDYFDVIRRPVLDFWDDDNE